MSPPPPHTPFFPPLPSSGQAGRCGLKQGLPPAGLGSQAALASDPGTAPGPALPAAFPLRTAQHMPPPYTHWGSLSPRQTAPGLLSAFPQPKRAMEPPALRSTPSPCSLECVSEKRVCSGPGLSHSLWKGTQLQKVPREMRCLGRGGGGLPLHCTPGTTTSGGGGLWP